MCQWGRVFWGELVRRVSERKMKHKETVLLTCTACPRIVTVHSLEGSPRAWVTLAVTFARQLVRASFPPQAPHWGAPAHRQCGSLHSVGAGRSVTHSPGTGAL